jgi:protein involved in ribonucleotide reduction
MTHIDWIQLNFERRRKRVTAGSHLLLSTVGVAACVVFQNFSVPVLLDLERHATINDLVRSTLDIIVTAVGSHLLLFAVSP